MATLTDGLAKAADNACGKDINRPQLELLLSFIREGDTLVCHSMDRRGHR